MDPTLADIVRKRIEMRDEIARIKKLQDEELKPAYRACEALDGMMLDYFSREGCRRLATDSGTAYKKISYKVKMLDRAEPTARAVNLSRPTTVPGHSIGVTELQVSKDVAFYIL